LEPVGFGLTAPLLNERLSSLADCRHELRLQKIIERIKFKALMKKFDVNLACETH
jgi:hypothetical protein